MSRPTYTGRLDGVLIPLGFEREKRLWTRVRGEIEEKLELQKSWIDGSVTVNVWAKNLETERILETIDCARRLGARPSSVRIGNLVDGRDRWWKNNPDGPAELAELVRVYAVPWFDRVRTLEDEAAKWYGRGKIGTWTRSNLGPLVVTLYRLGQLDEALALFEEPVPRTVIPSLLVEGRCLQRWLQAQKDAQ